MRLRFIFLASVCGIAAAAAIGLASAQVATPSDASASAQTLKAPADFDNIGDRSERSRAIFGEVSRVLMHPRCLNCHPAGDHPLQGPNHREHWPPVWRGEGGTGVAGASCSTCHTEGNVTLHEKASYQSIPGNPRWGLAPLSMAWEGKSASEICRQIKDKDRNGGRDLALLQEHVAKDDLVAWGWNPGAGREPAPGNQKLAGDLVQAWIDSGAECP